MSDARILGARDAEREDALNAFVEPLDIHATKPDDALLDALRCVLSHYTEKAFRAGFDEGWRRSLIYIRNNKRTP